MPEFVERPPQPSAYASYGSDLQVVRRLSEASPQTLSMAMALRGHGGAIPQVQAVTKYDAVHRCGRFRDKSEQSRRTMNMRHFPQLRLMDRASTSQNPRAVSSPAVAGSARSPQSVLRDFKRCDPVTQGAHLRRRISYPTEVARLSCIDSKFPRTELKATFEFAVKDPPSSARTVSEILRKPFVPANPHSARRGIASRFPNICETWSDDEWLSQANAGDAYAPRDRALRGVVFSTPPAKASKQRRGASPPPFEQSHRRKSASGVRRLPPAHRDRARVGALIRARNAARHTKPAFAPCSPSNAKAEIEVNYYQNSSTRSSVKDQQEDQRRMQEKIEHNKEVFNDKLFRRFHGETRARERRLARGSRPGSRSRSVGTPGGARY